MGIEVTGLDEVTRMLDGVRERMATPRPALEAWASTVEELVSSSAADGRTPEGTRWRLKKATPGRRSRSSRQAGVRTGAMLAAIVASVSSRSVTLEVLVPYARFFSSGSRKRGIPSRRLLPSRSRGPYGIAFAAFVASLESFVIRGRRGR